MPTFSNFADTSRMQLAGTAGVFSTGDGQVMRLTQALAEQAGSVFALDPVNTSSFSASFSFRMTNPGGITDSDGIVGADGITFTIKSAQSPNLGSDGSGLGYAGIGKSVAVEFDTFHNTPNTFPGNVPGDPSSNHVGIDVNGSVVSTVTNSVTPNFNDGNIWHVWVDYDGTTLQVRYGESDARPAAAQLSTQINLTGIIGSPQAQVGFTGGTAAGFENQDILSWSYTAPPVPGSGSIFFARFGGAQLWVTDGSPAGAHLVKDLPAGLGQGAGGIDHLTTIGNKLFFNASDGTHGEELWTSDGTAAGTVMVKDINPGPGDSDFFTGSGRFNPLLTDVNGALYFRATDGTHGVELWRSDGTAGGTQMVADILSGQGDGAILNLTNINGTLFFAANDGNDTGNELWKADAGGATLLHTFAHFDNPANLTNVNGTLFFLDTGANEREQVWKSDGTPAGTVQVSFNDGLQAVAANKMTASINGTFYFAYSDFSDGLGTELWKTDGTPAHTVMVKDINTLPPDGFGAGSSFPSDLTNVNGTLFFFATDGNIGHTANHGVELWKSNGTDIGTVMVKDINPGPNDSHPTFGNPNMIAAHGLAFFTADDGVHGRELWRSDGTAGGTFMLKDIYAGGANSVDFETKLLNVNGTVFFTAYDGENRELFKTDGTQAGTVELTTNGVDTDDIAALASLAANSATGTAGPDVLNGTDADDQLSGLGGNDTLNGGLGDDVLDGGPGADALNGGGGNDTYVVDNAGDVVTEAVGAGADTVLTSLASYVLGSNVENLSFTDNASHTGNGNGLGNVMVGGGGADTFFGGAGKDTLNGGDGNDTLLGNPGGAVDFTSEGNTLSGGNGNDTLYGDVSDIINGGAGADILFAINANPWTINLGATAVETMLAGFGDDHITAASQTVGVTVFAQGGNDTVTGSNFDDFLWGGVGNDTLAGGGGNDLLFGDLGADSFSGGAGNDTIYADSTDTLISGGAGNDALYWAAGVGANINLGADSIEFAQTLGDNDTLDGASASAALIVFAGAGNDTVNGGSGDDFLWGEAGTDTLVANGGNDTLVGGLGADKLTGGIGTDNIYGNSGGGGDGAPDTYIFTANWGTDFVYDFDDGIDKLDMTALHTAFANLTVTSSNGNAKIDFGANHIVVVGQAGHIDQIDFAF
jgi:ELWxxDGT repeat protein